METEDGQEDERKRMVEDQIVERGIMDERVIRAMKRVQRHEFVPEEMKKYAYSDGPIPIGEGQTISQPYMVALMTELLELSGEEKVLEVGTGSGYQTAILAELAGKVVSVELKKKLAEDARARLMERGYANIIVIHGDGVISAANEAPFDRIIVTAGAEEVPRELTEQLNTGGIMVIPVGDRMMQVLLKIRKTERGLVFEDITPCVFVPLVRTNHRLEKDEYRDQNARSRSEPWP